jgi:hypothetical protein
MCEAKGTTKHFAQSWSAEILPRHPLIAPAAQYIYPQTLTEDEGAREDASAGALEVMVKPGTGAPFLATFARGFAEPTLPHGIWSCPHADWLCAAAGGYVYMIDTKKPRHWKQIAYRPVVDIRAVPSQRLLLFTGFHSVLAWRHDGIAWESGKLSDEGVRITGVRGEQLHGFGWEMRSDKETTFVLDLRNGRVVGTSV